MKKISIAIFMVLVTLTNFSIPANANPIDFNHPKIASCDQMIQQVFRSYAGSTQAEQVPLLDRILQGFTPQEKAILFSQEYLRLKKEIEANSASKSKQYDQYTKKSYYKMGVKMIELNGLKSGLASIPTSEQQKKQAQEQKIAKLEAEIKAIRKNLDEAEAKVFKADAQMDANKKKQFAAKQSEIQRILYNRVQAIQNQIPRNGQGNPKYQIIAQDGQIRISQKPGDTIIHWDFLNQKKYSVHVNIDRLPENLTAEYKRECEGVPTKLTAKQRLRVELPSYYDPSRETIDYDRGDNSRDAN